MCTGASHTVTETQIWAAISHKYAALPIEAVAYLSKTLGPLSLVQWPKDLIPANARSAIDRILREAGSGGSELHSRHSQEVQAVLRAQDRDLLAALTFRGCPENSLRPAVWRAILRGFPGRRKGPAGAKPISPRDHYQKLRQRAGNVQQRTSSHLN